MFRPRQLAVLSTTLLLLKCCWAQIPKASYWERNGTEYNHPVKSTPTSYSQQPSKMLKPIATNVVGQMEDEMFEILGVKGRSRYSPVRSDPNSRSVQPRSQNYRREPLGNRHGHRSNRTATKNEELYRAALSGELAEEVVEKILDSSTENSIIDVKSVMEELRALSSQVISAPVSRTESSCSPLAVELKQFLSFLLLDRPKRRKRCDNCVSFGSFSLDRSRRSQLGHVPSIRLPVGLYGIVVPNELN